MPNPQISSRTAAASRAIPVCILERFMAATSPVSKTAEVLLRVQPDHPRPRLERDQSAKQNKRSPGSKRYLSMVHFYSWCSSPFCYVFNSSVTERGQAVLIQKITQQQAVSVLRPPAASVILQRCHEIRQQYSHSYCSVIRKTGLLLSPERKTIPFSPFQRSVSSSPKRASLTYSVRISFRSFPLAAAPTQSSARSK